MAFTRVNASGWAVNQKLTSAQINALDIDHANALDKSTAGDNIAGTVGFTGTGNLAITGLGQVKSAFANGIQANAAGAIQSNTVGGINLAGGATDNVTFAARTKAIKMQPAVSSLNTGWTMTVAAPSLVAPATPALQVVGIPYLINGATLSTLKTFLMVSSHANVPANLPMVQIIRRALPSSAAADAQVTMTVAAVPFPTPASGAAWTASSNVQNWTMTTTQNNVIDTSNYVYWISLADENGVNSIAGNQYIGFELGFTNITSYQASVG